MPMQPAALDLLKALAAVLDRWGRWYLFGAQAVVAYGVPRFSADVDVTVQLEPEDRSASFATWRPGASSFGSTTPISCDGRA